MIHFHYRNQFLKSFISRNLFWIFHCNCNRIGYQSNGICTLNELNIRIWKRKLREKIMRNATTTTKHIFKNSNRGSYQTNQFQFSKSSNTFIRINIIQETKNRHSSTLIDPLIHPFIDPLSYLRHWHKYRTIKTEIHVWQINGPCNRIDGNSAQL